MKKLLFSILLGVFVLPVSAFSQEEQESVDSLSSLASLGNIVTSVSKKPEDSFRSPAAIYVITNEDIKLSGATHVAEVLRGVPGMNVARFDSSNWAISSRGFNGFFSNKMLVLVDGRTIYTPLFSGVYWDIQNMPLEDIERIEIIRGPGATLWGANAVNGVINIITKGASETQGFYGSTIAGNMDRSITDLRYGSKIKDDIFYRTYAKYESRVATETLEGLNGGNSWDNAKGGFRSDWSPTATSKATVQGDAYNANINLDLFPPSLTSPTGLGFVKDHIRSKGANILGRWQEKHNDSIQSTFQAYIDYQSPDYSALQQDIYTFDIDYQNNWKINKIHDVTWGAGVRYIRSDLDGSSEISVARPRDNLSIFNTFIQDQIALINDELYLTVGSKFEHNTFTGFEVEPSARIAWSPTNNQTLWAAVSHAVRTPSIQEEALTLNVLAFPPDTLVQQQFNRNLDSEELNAYELGYRVRPTQKISIDSTVFYNDYKNLTTFEPADPLITPDAVILPFVVSNLGEGHAYGFETSAIWDITSRWNLKANYSYINLLLEQDSTSLDPVFQDGEDKVPHHQFSLRSQLFLPYDTQMINSVYYVDDLQIFNVEDYVRFDSQLIWQATPSMEISLVGQNLFDNAHSEFGAPLDGVQNEIPRAYYAKVTYRY